MSKSSSYFIISGGIYDSFKRRSQLLDGCGRSISLLFFHSRGSHVLDGFRVFNSSFGETLND